MKLTGEHLEQLTQGIQKTLLHGMVEKTECGVRSAEYGVRSTEYGVRRAEYGVRSAEYGVRSLSQLKCFFIFGGDF